MHLANVWSRKLRALTGLLAVGAAVPFVSCSAELFDGCPPGACVPVPIDGIRVSVTATDTAIVGSQIVTITLRIVNKGDRTLDVPDQQCRFGNLSISYFESDIAIAVPLALSNEICVGVGIPAKRLVPGDSIVVNRSFNEALAVARHTLAPGRYSIGGEVFMGKGNTAADPPRRVVGAERINVMVLAPSP